MRLSVFAVGMIGVICGAASRSVAQVQPRSPVWLGASVGFGSAHVGKISASGLSADLEAGLRIQRNIRIGVRLVGVTSIDIGDQPGWSGHTLLAVAGHDFADGLFALTAGVGSMHVRQKDSEIIGRSTVLKAGVEVGLTNCPARGEHEQPGISLRLLGLRTWALGQTRWKGSTFDFGNATQFYLGLGFVTC